MSIDAITKTSADYQTATSNKITTNKEVESVKEASESVASTMDSQVSRVRKNDTAPEITEGSRNSESQDNQAAEAVKKAVEEINKYNKNQTVQFGVHDKTGRMTIKILDKDTKNVVKEFPAEKTLDLIAKAWEMAGIMIDEKR